MWIVPAVFAIVFVLLFAAANPVIELGLRAIQLDKLLELLDCRGSSVGLHRRHLLAAPCAAAARLDGAAALAGTATAASRGACCSGGARSSIR